MKILLAAPTSVNKNYCIHEWISNARRFGCDIFISDNSLNNENKELYIKYGINYSWVDPKGKTSVCYITESQNQIREYFLAGDYTHLFFLETDLFPHPSLLSLLHSLDLPVVSAPYFIYKGNSTIQMNQEIKIVGRQAITRNYSLKESFLFTDGNVHQCYSVGFGCTLIKRGVVETLPFRYTGDNLTCNEDGSASHSDSFFYSDLQRLKIPAYLYTGNVVRHYNSDWSNIIKNEKLKVEN